jgi:hypothetical protein
VEGEAGEERLRARRRVAGEEQVVGGAVGRSGLHEDRVESRRIAACRGCRGGSGREGRGCRAHWWGVRELRRDGGRFSCSRILERRGNGRCGQGGLI